MNVRRFLSQLCVAAALAATSGSAGAQAGPRYRWAEGDTLRYRERTDGHVTMQPPAGAMEVRTEHEAVIALTPARGDTVRAWYTRLSLGQRGPGAREQRPATDALLGRPFVLRFSPSGQVRTEAVPRIPDEIAGMTDLTRQFDGFFISLPAGELRPGTEWADTVSRDQPARPGDTFNARSVRTYRVERDTTVEGVPVHVIRVRQQVRIEASSPMEGGATARTRLENEDEGYAVFSPRAGRLLGRTRHGLLPGQFTIVAGSQEVSFPQESSTRAAWSCCRSGARRPA